MWDRLKGESGKREKIEDEAASGFRCGEAGWVRLIEGEVAGVVGDEREEGIVHDMLTGVVEGYARSEW